MGSIEQDMNISYDQVLRDITRKLKTEKEIKETDLY